MNHQYNDDFAPEMRGDGRRGGGQRGGGRRGRRRGQDPERMPGFGAGPCGEGEGPHGRDGFGGGRRQGGFRGDEGRRRARRGDVRLAALLLANEQPTNGYQIMQRLTELSDGAWSVSSGAIYPALAQLEDEGLVEPVQTENRKAYRTTEAGQAAVAALGDAPRPWELAAEAQSRFGGDELRQALHQLSTATHAVAQASDPTLTSAATSVLTDAKRSLYRLLADGPVAAASVADGPVADVPIADVPIADAPESDAD